MFQLKTLTGAWSSVGGWDADLSWLGLDGSWNDLGWKSQVLAKVANSCVGQVPVIVAPGELLLDQFARGERLKQLSFETNSIMRTNLQGLDNLEVGDSLNIRVTLGVEILLGNGDTLIEEVLINEFGVALRDEHIDLKF